MGQVPQAIEHRLAELRSELATAEEEFRAQQVQIGVLRARLEEVETMRREILAGDDGDQDGQESRDLPEKEESRSETSSESERPGVTDAVLIFLSRSAGSVKPVTVVDALVDNVRTNSKNIRRTLFNTIYNLVKSGKLEKTAAGRVKLSKSRKEENGEG